MSNLRRHLSYIFWTFWEQAMYLALPRLVLFPLAAYIIGKESFGLFSTAMSFTLILGMQPQNGLATGLLRHLSECKEEDRPRFLGTSMRLSNVAMIIIVGIIVIGSLLYALIAKDSQQLIKCMIPLTIALYPENQFILALTEQRFLRQFKYRAFWMTLRSVGLLVLGISGALIAKSLLGPSSAVIGLAWGYLAGDLIAYGVLRVRRKEWYKRGFDREMSSVLKSVWLKISLAGILTVSMPHINRLVLSYFHSYDKVADFVAATSIMFIFLAPIQCFGILILSLISKYTSLEQLSIRGKIYCLMMLISGTLILPALLWYLGPIFIKGLYPKFGDEPLKLLKIVVWMIPAGTLFSVLSPFVLKFAPVKVVPIINACTFLVGVVCVFVLIPSYGASGAAWTFVITNIVSAVMFSIICTKLFIIKNK